MDSGDETPVHKHKPAAPGGPIARFLNALLPSDIREAVRSPRSKTRTVLILSMTLFILGPLFWIQWDMKHRPTVVVVGNYADMRQQTVNPSSQYSQPHRSGIEVEADVQQQLLGTALPELPPPKRDCLPSVDLPKLVTIRRWISRKPEIRESITILTQLSADRLNMLENQCRTWPDPLIASVYVPLLRNVSGGPPSVATYQNTTLDDVIRGMDSFHAYMEGTAMCALRMELVGQYLNPTDPQPYPINSLRNRALKAAKTELVFMLDVDFVASPLLGMPQPGYRDPDIFQQLINIANKKVAMVLPAFEITNRRQDLTMAQNFARNMVISGKSEIIRQYKLGAVDAFNGVDAPWGHGPTNTTKWTKLSRPIVYRIPYKARYEPFVILSRNAAPWFDERFVGYGGNKIAYINQLHGLDFKFKVHPYGFSIHVPHARTKAADIFVARKHRGASTMDELRQEVEDAVVRRAYVPVISACDKEIQNDGRPLEDEEDQDKDFQ